MGNALQDLDALEEAIDAYGKALSIKPNYAEASYNIGNALTEQEKLSEATDAYRKAIAINPNHTEAYYNMGNALKEQGKLDEAIKAFKKALAIKPDFAEAYNNMGNILQEQGELEEAINAFKEVLTIKPDHAEAYQNTSELLKIYTPKNDISHVLFSNDSKIKKLSPRILLATTDKEIIDLISEGLSYLNEDCYQYKTPLSQIFKRNHVDLNCKRHVKIFDTKDIIPEFCFGCFKVQVEVATVLDLIKVTSIFYKFNFEEDLSRKTGKGCRSLQQGAGY